MYLMYVDESGDVGLRDSPTDRFVLSGVVVHEWYWRDVLDRLYAFRKRMSSKFGLRIREELHASHFLNRPGDLRRIPRHDRLAILRHFLDELSRIEKIRVINVLVTKNGKEDDYDVFHWAWKALIQRFENTIKKQNFPNPGWGSDRGMIFPDETNLKKLRTLVRRMRYYNPIPNRPSQGSGYRNIPLQVIIEDPNPRTSKDSFLVQAADAVAYFLHQWEKPCTYAKKSGAYKYFQRLKPILCKVATSGNPWGIVRL